MTKERYWRWVCRLVVVFALATSLLAREWLTAGLILTIAGYEFEWWHRG